MQDSSVEYCILGSKECQYVNIPNKHIIRLIYLMTAIWDSEISTCVQGGESCPGDYGWTGALSAGRAGDLQTPSTQDRAEIQAQVSVYIVIRSYQNT